jgi:hypothetical protein
LRCGNKVIVMHSLETVKKYWTCSCERWVNENWKKNKFKRKNKIFL